VSIYLYYILFNFIALILKKYCNRMLILIALSIVPLKYLLLDSQLITRLY